MSRIAVLIPQLGIGGAERQAVRASSELAGAGECLLLVMTTHCEMLDREALDPRVELVVVDDSLSRWRRLAAARAALLRFKPDVVSAWLATGWVWALLAGLPRRRWTLQLMERNRNSTRPSMWRFGMLAIAKFTRSRVLSNSADAHREWAARIGNRAVEVPNIPPSAILERSVGDPRSGPVRFGVVGRLVHQKGIDIAITAIASPDIRHLTEKLVIVGTGPEEARYRELAQRLEVEHLIEFISPAFESVAELKSQIDVFLSPSRWEGTSNVLLELLASNAPLIASVAHAPLPFAVFPRVDPDAASFANAIAKRAWLETSIDPIEWEQWRRSCAASIIDAIAFTGSPKSC